MKQGIRIKGIPMKFYVDGASYNKTHRKEGIQRLCFWIPAYRPMRFAEAKGLWE